MFIYSIVHAGYLHTISEEIFPLVELHGIQKKCGVNDNKTKR